MFTCSHEKKFRVHLTRAPRTVQYSTVQGWLSSPRIILYLGVAECIAADSGRDMGATTSPVVMLEEDDVGAP